MNDPAPVTLLFAGLFPLDLESGDPALEDPSLEQVLELVGFVDGRRSDQLYMEGETASGTSFYVAIVGGRRRLTNMEIALTNDDTFILCGDVHPDDESLSKEPDLTSGGQQFHPLKRWLVDIDVASAALAAFLRTGRLDPASAWDRTSDFSFSPWPPTRKSV